MRRRDHGSTCPWRQPHSIGDDHAVPIHRHRNCGNMHMPQQFSRRRVSRALKPDAIARLQQGMTNQPDGVAISRRHEYLRWRAVDPTRHLEICGDLGTQCRQAVYRGMSHVRWLRGTHTSCAQACPDLSRKRIQGRQTHLERQNRIWTKTSRGNAAVGPGDRACNRRSRLEARRHDGPGLAAGLNVSFSSQQRISRLNGASCQAQFLGQRTRRGNAVTRLQQSARNSTAKPIVDLAIERFGRRWIQRRDLAGLGDAHGLAISADELETIMPHPTIMDQLSISIHGPLR